MPKYGTGFPRISLASAVKIMESALKFGKEWKRETFATYGAKNNAGSAKSGAFATRLAALKDYGLIIVDKDTIAPTELAQTIVKPISESEKSEAIRNAFLQVSVFKQIFDNIDGDSGVEKSGILDYAIREIGVFRDSVNKFFAIFIDSGKFAGLVQYDKDNDIVAFTKSQNNNDVDPVENKTIPTIFTQDAEPMQQTEPPMSVKAVNSSPMNEQGVNHSGSGWALTVMIKSNRQLPKSLRTEIRNLLDKADDVADLFYELEKREKSEN